MSTQRELTGANVSNRSELVRFPELAAAKIPRDTVAHNLVRDFANCCSFVVLFLISALRRRLLNEAIAAGTSAHLFLKK